MGNPITRNLTFLASNPLYKTLANVPITSVCATIIAMPTYLQLLLSADHDRDHDGIRVRSAIIEDGLEPLRDIALGLRPSA